jgi:hypothetical protein
MTTPAEEITHPWQQRPDESSQAFEGFSHYLAQPPPRRLLLTAGAEGKSISQIRKWSARYEWRARAYQHDIALMREVEEQARRSQQALHERQLRDAEWLQKVAMGRLGRLVRRDEATGELVLDGELTPRDAMAMYKLAEDILRNRARSPRSDPPAPAEAQLDALSDEQLWNMLRLVRERAGKEDADED